MKKIKHIIFIISVGIISFLLVTVILFPDEYQEIIPYHFYNVLTNSMEPKIGVHDLVLVKNYHEDMDIQKNDIITFRANRFGESVIITHRFSHIEVNEKGEKIYRTHPEQSDTFDPYETKSEDILGVYVLHVPYIGKLILFLKSGFGLLWICEIIVILMIKATIKVRWQEKGYQFATE